KDELDIYDIPIAHITTQYLGFLQQIHSLNIEQASDFILMAATLMRIKSQIMLPREELGLEGEGEEDPRAELVRRLLEYQQFKEIADWLEVRKEQRSGVYLRQPGAIPETEEPAELRPVSLFDLLAVYKHVIDNVPDNLVHQILEEEVSVEECIENILAVLERDARVNFTDLLQSRNRQALIATFVGILELLKSQRIRVQQARPFDEIWIEGRKGGSPLVITSDRGAQEREQ
ncbi:MAG: segregation/condensation protein A, partial [Candidatus Latescibacteria bacterium]|nr:segregation/condensation protein A [Candidatus Latescibacterota bacterium]